MTNVCDVFKTVLVQHDAILVAGVCHLPLNYHNNMKITAMSASCHPYILKWLVLFNKAVMQFLKQHGACASFALQ